MPGAPGWGMSQTFLLFEWYRGSGQDLTEGVRLQQWNENRGCGSCPNPDPHPAVQTGSGPGSDPGVEPPAPLDPYPGSGHFRF